MKKCNGFSRRCFAGSDVKTHHNLFTWRVLSSAQTFHKRRIVEEIMIQQFRPSLNKQVISYVSKLFPTGITQDTYAWMHADGLF